MKRTLIRRSEKAPDFIKPKWYDMRKSNVLVTGEAGKGISQHFVFAEEDRNILVRGSVGKGKTWLLKQTINIMIEDFQVTILDGCGEYQEYKERVCVIPFAHEGVFLSLSEQKQCKQSHIVVIDEMVSSRTRAVPSISGRTTNTKTSKKDVGTRINHVIPR